MQSRRRFLEQLELMAGGIVCGTVPAMLGGCAARMRYVTPSVVGDRLAVPATAVVAAGLLIEAPGAELPIYLRRTTTGDFTAVSTRCMHRGCQVEPAAERLVCPCHGSEYTFAGEVVQGPTEHALTRYRVTSDRETVYIHMTPERTS